jgi:peptidyl-prolyl cis-trans isomerase D
MFEFIQRNKKIMQILLIILIFPSFVLFGIDGYKRFNDKSVVAASIDGRDISVAEWEQAQKNEVERMRTSMPGMDVSMFDTPAIKFMSLERIVRSRVLESSASKLNIKISDQKLAKTIGEVDSFAALKKADGSFDIEKYKSYLSAQGMTPDIFESRVRSDLAVRQVIGGVNASSFASLSQATVSLDAFLQQREIQVAIFSASDYLDVSKPTEEEVKSYFLAHAQDYQTAETVDIEYVVFDLPAVEKSITVSEAELKTYFDQNQSLLKSKEERRASHILISSSKEASSTEKKSAIEKAQNLLVTLRKSPQLFADLAKKNSQDPGSSTKGGDLDFFARGSMVKPFEEVAFSLKKGEISEIVETEFGYHIILLTDIKSAGGSSFADAKTNLEQDLKKDLAKKKFAELAEQFTNMVYEQSDSLKPVSQKFKLEVQVARDITKQTASASKALWSNPKLLQSIFSADAIAKKQNTEAIETSTNQLVSARVISHKPVTNLQLDDIKPSLVQSVLSQKSVEAAKREGEEKLKLWRNDLSLAKLQGPVLITREQNQKLPPSLIEAAMRADASKLPLLVGVDLGAKGFGMVKINSVSKAAPINDRKDSVDKYAKAWTSAESIAYFNFLKSRSKVQYQVEKPVAGNILKQP